MRLERNFFVWNCTSLVAFIVPVSSIAVASRIKDLYPVNVNNIPVVLPARFLVIPRLSALAAFQIHAWRYSPAISARLPNAFMLGVRRSCPSNAVLAIENCAMTAPCGLYFSSDLGRDSRLSGFFAWGTPQLKLKDRKGMSRPRRDR